MILAARVDHERAVDLFKEDHAHELMRKGHVGKGEQQIRPRLDAGVQPARGTDDEGDLLPFAAQYAHTLGKRFARQLFTLHREHDDIAAQLLYDMLRLLRERAALGKFKDAHVGKAVQTFRIFRDRIRIKFFFQFAHANDTDLLHRSAQPVDKIREPHDRAQDDADERGKDKRLDRPLLFPIRLFIEKDEIRERRGKAHRRHDIHRDRPARRNFREKIKLIIKDDDRVVQKMYEYARPKRIGTDRQKGEHGAADELIHRLRRVLMENGKEQPAQETGRDRSDILDAVEHDAAENGFFTKCGKYRHDEQYAEKARARKRRQLVDEGIFPVGEVGVLHIRRLVAEQFQKFYEPAVHPIQTEQQAERKQDRYDKIFRTDLSVPEHTRALLIDLRKGKDHADIDDLIQEIRKVLICVRLLDIFQRGAARRGDERERYGKDERYKYHSDDGARIHDAAHRLARLIE